MIGWFFAPFLVKLYWLLASISFMAFALSDYKLAPKLHSSVPRHGFISDDRNSENGISSFNAEIFG